MNIFENLFFDKNPDYYHYSIIKPKINYYYEYFSHTNELRKKEIDYTLAFNCMQSPNTNKYIICSDQYLNECKKIINDSKNTTIIAHNERCTFQYVFNLSNIITTDSDINITSSNNDILLNKVFFENIAIQHSDFYWLSRYEKITDKHPTLHTTGYSADTWVWKGKNKITEANFYE
jgi:sugar-specific transcriptional regulator TrmB